MPGLEDIDTAGRYLLEAMGGGSLYMEPPVRIWCHPGDYDFVRGLLIGAGYDINAATLVSNSDVEPGRINMCSEKYFEEHFERGTE